MFDQSTINYEVYEDNVDYVGITDTALPDVTFLTAGVSGAGIGGNFDAVITSMIDAMSVTLNFQQATKRTIKLTEPRRHKLTFMVANQYDDPVANALGVESAKHVMICIPKSHKMGTLKPATPTGGSVEMSVLYWGVFSEGVKILELDPLNNKCFVNGTDYAAPVRKAIGKS
jgi:P2 family phage contractile tail tube protein